MSASPTDRPADCGQPVYPPLPAELVEFLGLYVYGLVDPRPGADRLLYLGKGRGQRIRAHVWAALVAEDDAVAAVVAADEEAAREVAAVADDLDAGKIARIREIHAEGLEVQHVLLGWLGDVSAAEALDPDAVYTLLETVAIDAAVLARTGDPHATLADAGLSNVVRGAGSRMCLLDDLEAELRARPTGPLDDDFAAVVINKKFRPGMDRAAVLHAASGDWSVGPESRGNPDLKIIVLARNLVRTVVRPRNWWQDSDGYWHFEPVVDEKLHALLSRTRLEPRNVGLDKWPQRGWVPQVNRYQLE